MIKSLMIEYHQSFILWLTRIGFPVLIACLSTNVSSINPLKLEVGLIGELIGHILKIISM